MLDATDLLLPHQDDASITSAPHAFPAGGEARFVFQACDDDYLPVQHQLPLSTDLRRFRAVRKWVSPFGMRAAAFLADC